MKSRSMLLSLAALALAVPATAGAGKVDPTTVTCEAFASQTPEAQQRVAAYLDGYSKRGTKLEDIGEIDVDREVDTLVVACQQAPKLTLWQKIEMKLPGGKKRVKIPMTCDEYLALETDVQPEVAYFLAGYNRKQKTEVAAEGEVEIERDVAVLVEECKPTPKESLWAKIKKHF